MPPPIAVIDILLLSIVTFDTTSLKGGCGGLVGFLRSGDGDLAATAALRATPARVAHSVSKAGVLKLNTSMARRPISACLTARLNEQAAA